VRKENDDIEAAKLGAERQCSNKKRTRKKGVESQEKEIRPNTKIDNVPEDKCHGPEMHACSRKLKNSPFKRGSSRRWDTRPRGSFAGLGEVGSAPTASMFAFYKSGRCLGVSVQRFAICHLQLTNDENISGAFFFFE